MDPRVLNPDAGRDKADARKIVYPAWMDGLYVTTASHYVTSEPIVIAPMGTFTIPADAKRWAIGIIGSSAMNSDLVVSPDPNPQSFALFRATTQAILWLTLFNHGPIVTGQLYLYSAVGGTFKYISIEV